MHAHRGNKVCTNSLLVPQPVLETQLLAGLEASVFNPPVVSYTLQDFEQQLLREIERRAGETCAPEKQIADLERKIRNCTAAIAEGRAFKSLLEQLGSLEAELQQTKARAESAKPGALRVRMQDTRRFVEGKLRELQKLLNAKPRMARMEMARHIKKRIVHRPEGKTYVAVGDWNLGGVSYGGAGGPVYTTRSTDFSFSLAA
jgi:hypothetical protein